MNQIQSINYPIYFNSVTTHLNNFINEGKYSRFFILTDEHTSTHCLPYIREKLNNRDDFDLIEINAGEESKTIDFCIGIWKMLIDFDADRSSLLINLGGGVVTDLGGFAASTFKRGIDFIHIPTTLLSQVDASVGGKTGIDIDNLKNIIGTFTQPKAVFIEHAFLSTLPARQVKSGMAEMLKHGLIADASYWNVLKISDLENPTDQLIYQSVVIKNKVVTEDPSERGIRKILNFGHTIGHALESYSLDNDSNPLTHGEAIAAGMICEAYLSHLKAGLPAGDMQEIVDTLLGVYGKYPIHESCYTALNAIMKKDKKNQGGKINCSLLTKIGECRIDNICTDDELCDSLKYYASLQYAQV
ncbi:3-dehydroquinate synthase [Mucilaginibacter paludis]|uniref:3-dehydroquinate synthase n=1 Tax=Mucilaginibacter paludis DSM 18603 TaxID=714943 RepID=H1Y3P7_9SPHI|nr:3-dehydroquinate synthase [Mucilaginibacter paludis]EHQ30309.1 3-dehydroquinate synthase [Mucilaginibacter paludis DSM 18603]